ncbi:MAG TPA: hypothetical protein VEX11_02825 [Acetobacteraceae bacterium]|nr:hypothetical protein [Acetobacteraceae bacterium]
MTSRYGSRQGFFCIRQGKRSAKSIRRNPPFAPRLHFAGEKYARRVLLATYVAYFFPRGEENGVIRSVGHRTEKAMRRHLATLRQRVRSVTTAVSRAAPRTWADAYHAAGVLLVLFKVLRW